MQNGKGDKDRVKNLRQFRSNWDEINWGCKYKEKTGIERCKAQFKDIPFNPNLKIPSGFGGLPHTNEKETN